MSSLSQSSPLLELSGETPLSEAGHAPSSVDSEPQEVSTVIQRVLRAFATDVDAERIEAHREAVRREVDLTNPMR
ncbi:hypothetical protein [Sinomonas albida]|uniref:hypothetical protein n=1 Tax=Sinomonas albida TaxID=369942 RepID=UPI0010A7A768|nr:hypothetical protein [Sinomonas albida]